MGIQTGGGGTTIRTGGITESTVNSSIAPLKLLYTTRHGNKGSKIIRH